MPLKNSRRKFLRSSALVGTGLTGMVAGCLASDLTGGGDGSIMIGAAIANSGELADEGSKMNDGYECMVKWINEEKGGLDVGGTTREVELLTKDDQSDCETTARLYSEFINQEGIELFIGPYTSSCTYAAGSAIQKNDLVMVQTNLSLDIFETYNEEKNYIYTINPLSPTTMHGILDLAESKGSTTVGMMSDNKTYAQAVLEGAHNFIEDSGLEVVVDETIPSETKDVSGPIGKMVNEEVDVVLVNSHQRIVILGFQELMDTGYNPDIFGESAIAATTGLFWEEFGRKSIGALSNALWDTSVVSPDAPWGFGSQEAMKYYRENVDDEGWNAFDFWAINGMTPVSTLLYAVEQAGSTEPNDVRQALDTMDTQGLNGLNMNYRTPEDEGLAGTISAGWNAGQKQGEGENPIVWPPEVANTEPIYPKPTWEELES